MGIFNMHWLLKFIRFHLQKHKICRRFKREMGTSPNLMDPVLYDDKIQYRKLFGNHPFYAMIADKYKVRDYVTERVGSEYLVPLLGVYDHLSPEVFDDLPDQFIIKCNHGCKWNRIISSKNTMDINEIVCFFNSQLKRKYGRASYERHYDLIDPKIVIEQLLDDDGECPWDYNIYSYNGSNGFDFAIGITSPDMSRTAHFDRNWNVLDTNFSDQQIEKYANPVNFKEMVNVARLLSADFDFVRVDLYNIAGKIYFGELTCTPGSGFGGRIENKARARMRDEMWELDADNKLLYQKRGWVPN